MTTRGMTAPGMGAVAPRGIATSAPPSSGGGSATGIEGGFPASLASLVDADAAAAHGGSEGTPGLIPLLPGDAAGDATGTAPDTDTIDEATTDAGAVATTASSTEAPDVASVPSTTASAVSGQDDVSVARPATDDGQAAEEPATATATAETTPWWVALPALVTSGDITTGVPEPTETAESVPEAAPARAHLAADPILLADSARRASGDVTPPGTGDGVPVAAGELSPTSQAGSGSHDGAADSGSRDSSSAPSSSPTSAGSQASATGSAAPAEAPTSAPTAPAAQPAATIPASAGVGATPAVATAAPAPTPVSPSAAGSPSTVTRQVFGEVLRMTESGPIGPTQQTTRHVTLRLNPDNLGEVRVTLSLRGSADAQGEASAVRVRLSASTEAARAALTDGSADLHHLLARHHSEVHISVRDAARDATTPNTALPSGPTPQQTGSSTDQNSTGGDAGRPDVPTGMSDPGTSADRNPGRQTRMPVVPTATDGTPLNTTGSTPGEPAADRLGSRTARLDVSV